MNNYDFTDLILLVGTNPLPNYVVGKFFLGEKEKGNCAVERIWLVCTSDTQEIAEKRIKPALQKVNSLVKIGKLPLQSDYKPKAISNDLKGFLKELKDKGRKFHINYTGGTKSMSVHSHKDFRDLDKEESRFSYLHAKSYSLIDDKDNVLCTDLRKVVSIDFKELCELHSADLKHFNLINCESDLFFPTAIKKIETLINDGKITDLLDAKFRKENLESLCKADLNNQSQIDNFIIKGDWFEKYVSYLLLSLGKIPIYQNIEINISNVKCEIDICFLVGYQLVGISCGTGKGEDDPSKLPSKKKELKLKGFEISSRLRQIGGDESLSFIAIPGMSEPRNILDLKNELKMGSGGGVGSIDVLERKDLKTNEFQKKIQSILK